MLDGKVNIAKEYDTPDWSPDKAQNEMEQALTALGNKVDGVYAANDGTAGGAIAAMKAAGINPLPPVTGQDAELAGIQRILVGEQYMTVYKAIKPEAEAAAQLAVDLLNGKAVAGDMVNGATVNNGKKDVPSVLLDPGRRDQGQHQGHRRQGRLLDAAADLHRSVRQRMQGERPLLTAVLAITIRGCAVPAGRAPRHRLRSCQ